MARDEPPVRAFVGVLPPPELADAVGAAVAAVRRPGDRVSWVRPANLHYTMRFLGDLAPGRVAAAGRAVAAAVVGVTPFVLRLGAPGCFPPRGRPQVLWLGAAEGGEALARLARSLDLALEREGFAGAGRPFAPHLTLGRVREGSARGGAEAGERFLAARFPGDGFEVRELALVASTLSPGGSIYRPIARHLLTA